MAKQDASSNDQPQTSGSEVATAAEETAAVAVPATGLALQFRDWVQQVARDGAEDRAFRVMSRQLEQVLSAETEDEIMAADMQPTFETRDLVDMEIEVQPELDFVPSADRFQSPLGVYVQFVATALIAKPDRNIAIGQQLIISSGAPLVIGKLRTLQANGYLPRALRIEGVEAPNGTVLKLGNISGRAVRSQSA